MATDLTPARRQALILQSVAEPDSLRREPAWVDGFATGADWERGRGRDEDAHRDGLIVARRVARWQIGDPDLADLLISAYLNPDAAQANLEQETRDL